MLPSATRTDVVGGKEKKGWMENKMPQEVISSLPLGPRIAAKTWIPESRYSQSPEEEPQKPKPRAGGSPRDRVILRCRDGPLGRFVHKGRRVKGTLYTRTEVCWLPHGFFFFFSLGDPGRSAASALVCCTRTWIVNCRPSVSVRHREFCASQSAMQRGFTSWYIVQTTRGVVTAPAAGVEFAEFTPAVIELKLCSRNKGSRLFGVGDCEAERGDLKISVRPAQDKAPDKAPDKAHAK